MSWSLEYDILKFMKKNGLILPLGKKIQNYNI